MPTIKSGAFLQQCFSSHPLSLAFKILTVPDRIVLACANCHMRHRFTIRTLTVRPAQNDPEQAATESLARCGQKHPAELRVSGVDVVQDAVKFRCGECHRTYSFDVATFETYQKDS
jgi:hypothetical protein